MPELGLSRERIVFVSGIGCAARFPYYMQTYGMHSIHGRAPAIATGLAVTPPGPFGLGRDGRRRRALDRREPPDPRAAPERQPQDPALQQPDLRADEGPVLADLRARARSRSRRPWGRSTTRSTRSRSRSAPRRRSSRARSTPTRRGSPRSLGAAARHRGSAFVEILQNCNIYNDGAFDYVREDKANRIYLEHGAPIRFGAEGEKGVVAARGRLGARRRRRGRRARTRCSSTTPPTREPSLAFALSRITFETDGAVPFGVFRRVERPVYDDLMSEQLEAAREQRGEGDLEALLHSSDTWTSPEPGRGLASPGRLTAALRLSQEADDPLRDLLALLLLQEVAGAGDDLGRALRPGCARPCARLRRSRRSGRSRRRGRAPASPSVSSPGANLEHLRRRRVVDLGRARARGTRARRPSTRASGTGRCTPRPRRLSSSPTHEMRMSWPGTSSAPTRRTNSRKRSHSADGARPAPIPVFRITRRATRSGRSTASRKPDRPAPVLHDDRRLAQVELVGEPLDRGVVEVVGVVVDLRGLVRATEAEVVRRDDARHRSERRDQLPIEERPGRLAVQEQDGVARAFLDVVHPQPVLLDVPAARTSSPGRPSKRSSGVR